MPLAMMNIRKKLYMFFCISMYAFGSVLIVMGLELPLMWLRVRRSYAMSIVQLNPAFSNSQREEIIIYICNQMFKLNVAIYSGQCA